jgi:hypothetical protein
MESFPVHLVGEGLAGPHRATGLSLEDAEVYPSENYRDAFGDVPHKSYRRL